MIRKKLTRKAKTAKAKRDLRYANSRSREIKRADSQKKRRAARKAGKNIKGKDYDHKDRRFKSIKETVVMTVKELKKKKNELDEKILFSKV